MRSINLLAADNTLFLIIDIQEKLLNAVYNRDVLEKKAEIIAKAANILEIPVIVSEQYPQGLGETVAKIKTSLSDETKFFTKTAFNAMDMDELSDTLKGYNCKNIVILGIETHICVYQTALELLRQQYNVTILIDACGSRAEEEYLAALNLLKSKGADLKTTEMVLFEILKGAKHPKFKDIQALIK